MRARWGDEDVLVKLLLDNASGRRNMRHELTGNRMLENAGIKTPRLLLNARCVAEGEDANGVDGAWIVVFEFLTAAQTLDDLWREQAHRRSDIAASCVDVMARLARKGCRHTDSHLNNFLLSDEQIYVIDVAAIRRKKNFAYGMWQRENWARFLVAFDPLWQEQVLRLIRAADTQAGGDKKLPQAIERLRKRRKSRSLKKCFRDCTDFSARASWRQRAVWRRDWESADLVSFLRNPDAWIAKGELLKGGNSATVICAPMDGRSVVIKRNNMKHLSYWLRRCLRTSRCRINWRNAHLLRISGIETPEPIAFVERRWGPFRFEGYYVCAYDSSPSVEKKYASKPPTQPELDRFSELFKRMSLARIYHGDLKSSNLLVTDKGIALIDLESMKTGSAFNIAILQQKDRNRFLKNWQDKPAQWKLFSEVFRSTDSGGY